MRRRIATRVPTARLSNSSSILRRCAALLPARARDRWRAPAVTCPAAPSRRDHPASSSVLSREHRRADHTVILDEDRRLTIRLSRDFRGATCDSPATVALRRFARARGPLVE